MKKSGHFGEKRNFLAKLQNETDFFFRKKKLKNIVHDNVIMASTVAMTSSIPPPHDIIIAGNA